MMIEWEDPRVWVTVAFVVFLALAFFFKLPAMLMKPLDDRSAKIRADLEEAQRLRAEAAALLAQFQEKQESSLKESEAILADASRDAESLREYAARDLKASLDARMQQAMEKIAREEASAIDEVRNHIVDMSLSAARSIIASDARNQQAEVLMPGDIAELVRKIH